MSNYLLLMLVLLCGLVMSSLIERIRPHRRPTREGRWANLSLGVLSHATSRIALPAGLGVFAMQWHWGLLHVVDLPTGVAVAAGVVLLDVVKYGQHVLFHKVGFFWRFHKVHHSDIDLDVTTALRFHPGQALISTAISVVAVMLLGLPMASIFLVALLHEIVLLVTHLNLNFGPGLDRAIRIAFVSPRMHWVHHSAIPFREHDHNYGICFSWWDRLFGTYLSQSSAGDDFPFGIDGQSAPPFSLVALLVAPARR